MSQDREVAGVSIAQNSGGAAWQITEKTMV